MSNENTVSRVPRVTPIMYPTLTSARVLNKALEGRNAKMSDNSNEPASSSRKTVTMSTRNGNAATPKISYTHKMGDRPKLASEDSSTTSGPSFDTTRGIQGSPKCPSLEPFKSGNSTDSSDQPLAVSRPRSAQTSEPLPENNKKKDKGKQPATDSPKPSSQATAQAPPSDQPPKPDPRAGYIFVRGKIATCGCLYLIEVGPKGFATVRDLKKAGFPRHGHYCPKCKYVTAEIRVDDDGNAVVTEIELRPPTPDRENDISSQEDPEDYMDGDDDEYDEDELMDMFDNDMYQQEEGSYFGGGHHDES